MAADRAGRGAGRFPARHRASGVSAQRSLWSTYERMQGVVDLAHWFALAVVLASMFRAASEWRALLTFNLAMSLAIACLVIARHYQLDVPFYGAFAGAEAAAHEWARSAIRTI